MSIPSIIVGRSNWAVKPGNLLGYANSQDRIVPREFAVTRALDTATRINSDGYIELVPANVPRVDFLGGQGRLLVEPSGSNLLLRSEEFDNASWSGSSSGTTVTPNAINSPSNTLTADLITRTTGGNIQQAIALTSGTTYTSSYFLKKGTVGNEVLIIFTGTGFSVSVTVFNFDTLTLTDTTGTTANKSIIDYGNGWYRISLTKTATSTNNGIFRISQNNNSENYYIWGAQVETGSVATSYIPTTTASVTRNADVVSLAGVAGLIGQTEGTIYAEVDVRHFANAGIFFSISDGTSSNRVQVYKFTDSKIYADRISATQSALTSISTSALTTGVYKLAFAYKTGDSALFINGVQIGSTALQTFTMGALTKVNVGTRFDDTQFLNDRISAAELHPTRLTNAQLATLTAL